MSLRILRRRYTSSRFLLQLVSLDLLYYYDTIVAREIAELTRAQVNCLATLSKQTLREKTQVLIVMG